MAAKVISIHYLPNIQWFRELLKGDVVLDQHEHYRKQTYRNRCIILSANGPLPLTVPVKKKDGKMTMKETGIENEFSWQKQHWEAICSAYNSSPYFEYYRDYFEKCYHTKYEGLQQLNADLIRICLKILRSEAELVFSENYMPSHGPGDLRETISPKHVSNEKFRPYLQVFAGKFSFQPNLSIIDLICNQGPDAMAFIS